MITVDFTFQTVTSESAEHGDFDSTGFILPGRWKFDVNDYECQQWKLGDLAGLIAFAQELGIQSHPDADWFYSIDPDINYETGEETTYAMHIAGVSVATYKRIARLLD